ncbi:MAG: CoA-binding protein, partial [bacterium]
HLLHPRSAAVCGASNKSVNAGRIILRNLKVANGLEYGHLYAIHPSAPSIDGVKCYRDAAALPEGVDLAIVSVPAAGARAAIGDLIRARRARAIILIPGGFAETGRADLAREIQDDLAVSRARGADGIEAGGPVLLGGNCLGVVSKGEYNTFFLPHYKLPFHDAPGDNLVVVSQSGAYLVTLSSNLDGIIFPRASISYGNEMDLTASDFLEYYLDHEEDARIFGFYIEGFPEGEGRRFLSLVRRATSGGRAVVVYKAGKTAAGAQAAASHTASMTGDYEVARALFAGAGAIVTETLNMFSDYTKSLTMLAGRTIGGRRVGVITNAGFEAAAVSDHLYSLELASLTRETEERVAAALPEIAHAQNPVDATPMAETNAFIAAVEAVAADPNVDMLIVSAIPAAATLDVLAPDLTGAHEENIFAMGSLPAELIRVNRSITKPMVVTIDSGRLYDPSVTLLQRAGIPVFRKIDRASRALSAVASFHLDTRGRRAAR